MNTSSAALALLLASSASAIGLRASTSVRVDDECTPDSTRPVRSGERFKFNLIGEDAKCVDGEGNLYSYGLFEGVEDNEKCADACVNDVSSELAAALQGYNFKCGAQECECLFEEGFLTNSDCDDFDDCDRDEDGEGPIDGSSSKKEDWNCYKLVGTELLQEGLEKSDRTTSYEGDKECEDDCEDDCDCKKECDDKDSEECKDCEDDCEKDCKKECECIEKDCLVYPAGSDDYEKCAEKCEKKRNFLEAMTELFVEEGLEKSDRTTSYEGDKECEDDCEDDCDCKKECDDKDSEECKDCEDDCEKDCKKECECIEKDCLVYPAGSDAYEKCAKDCEKKRNFLEAMSESFSEVETSKGKRFFESDTLTYDNCEKECEKDCEDYCKDEAAKDCKGDDDEKECEKDEEKDCEKKECKKDECVKDCECLFSSCVGRFARSTKEYEKCGESCSTRKKEYNFLSAVM